MKLTVLVFGVFLCHLSFAGDFDQIPDKKELQKNMPDDVVAFISKSSECNHWGGEEPYDKERADYIAKAVEKAGCNNLYVQEAALRKKYAKNSKVISSINRSKDLIE